MGVLAALRPHLQPRHLQPATTSVNGAGNPAYADIKKVAEQANVKRWAAILDEVRNAVAQWPALAAQYGISATRSDEIHKALKAVDRDCAPAAVKTKTLSLKAAHVGLRCANPAQAPVGLKGNRLQNCLGGPYFAACLGNRITISWPSGH